MTDPNTPAGAPTPPQEPVGSTPPPPAYDAPSAAPAAPPAYDAPAAPPAAAPYPTAPPAGEAPYAAAPPAPYGAPATQTIPGKTLGIVAFVLAVVPIGLQLIGLILGIVALVQSKKAGYKNGWALAAIIVGAALLVIGIIIAIVAIVIAVSAYGALCDGMPPGVYELQGGGTITCG